MLASQGLDGCIEQFGERLTYQIFGGCVNQAMLRTSSSRTADFFSRQVGKYETIEINKGSSSGPGGTSYSQNEQKVVRDAVMASEFQVIPMASRERGFEGIYLGELGAWHAHLTPSEIDEHIGKPNPDVPAFVGHKSEPLLRPWDEKDLERSSLPAEILGDTDKNEVAEVEAEDESPQSDQVEGEQDPATEKSDSIWSRLAGLVGGRRNKRPEPRAEPPANGQKPRE